MYAFLAPFLILGTAGEAVRAWKDGTALWPRVRSTGAAVLRSRYMALGVFALLFGAAVLGFNFANEYAAFGGETAVTELPSFRSMLGRIGLDGTSKPHEWWLSFLRGQFIRVCVASVPSMLTDRGGGLLGLFPSVPSVASLLSGPELSFYRLALLMVVVASTTVLCLVRGLLAWRRWMLLATLALSGFFWTLPMRRSVAVIDHDHAAMFYVGVPLVFHSLLLLYIHKRWGHRPVVGLAVAALLAFVVSAFQMDRGLHPDAHAVELRQAALAELGTIRETTRGEVVLVLASVEPEWSRQAMYPYYALRYYLAGSVLAQSIRTEHSGRYYPAGSVLTHFPDMEAAARAADFIVTRDRVESDALLTPHNEQVFLYGSAGMDDLVELYRATYRQVVSGEPAARSYFDVYLRDDSLIHVKDPCVREDVGYGISVKVIPEDPEDLTGRRMWYGFEDINTFFQQSGVLFEGKCMAIVALPDYPISVIRTGKTLRQYREKSYYRWEVEIPVSR